MKELYDHIIDLRAACQKEWMEREQVKQSPAYLGIEGQIKTLLETVDSLRKKQDERLAAVPNSLGALEEAKKSLYEAMRAAGRDEFGDAKIKYSNKSEVNKERLLRELEGDLDTYITLSNVTQASLKEYAKTTGEKRLLGCIETVSTPAGIDFPSA